MFSVTQFAVNSAPHKLTHASALFPIFRQKNPIDILQSLLSESPGQDGTQNKSQNNSTTHTHIRHLKVFKGGGKSNLSTFCNSFQTKGA